MLAHSVLGLGASHMSLHGNIDYNEQALSHRVTAIQMVNDCLSSTSHSPAEADAVFGAVLCLIAQTGLMADGMCEYHVMTRGCTLLMHAALKNEDKTMFSMFTAEAHMDRIRSIMEDQHGDFTDLRNFHQSLLNMKHLLVAQSQMDYFDGLIACVHGMNESVEAGKSSSSDCLHAFSASSAWIVSFWNIILILYGF